MRLINTQTLELKEVQDCKGYRYAVLSHRWLYDRQGNSKETSFEQFSDKDKLNLHDAYLQQQYPGMLKVKIFCSWVRAAGCQWAWADTCCINKSKDDELDVAIRSMWKWYRESAFCVAYLDDVCTKQSRMDQRGPMHTPWGWINPMSEAQAAEIEMPLLKCVWWTRGWTLQELVGPVNLFFFDQGWNFISGRDEAYFGQIVFRAAGVSSRYIGNEDAVYSASVAERMSWVANRTTRKPEDMSYCMQGILDVNIAPQYGEGGEKAFMRLQEQLLTYSCDESIFAWLPSRGDKAFEPTRPYGMLATSPKYFRWIRDEGVQLDVSFESSQWIGRQPYSLRSNLLTFESFGDPRGDDPKDPFAFPLVPLNCCSDPLGRFCIRVYRFDSNKWCRAFDMDRGQPFEKQTWKMAHELPDPDYPGVSEQRFTIHVQQKGPFAVEDTHAARNQDIYNCRLPSGEIVDWEKYQ